MQLLQMNATPPHPTSLPFPAIEEHRDDFRKWLIDHYNSSIFNTCEHQTLPFMEGLPLKLNIKLNTSPVVMHTPIAVFFHWKDEVKSGLDRDIRLEVLEPVFVGATVR